MGSVALGSLLIYGVTRVEYALEAQDAPPFREGTVGRADRQNVRLTKIEDLSGGLGILNGSEATHANRVRESEGPWSFQPGGLFQPPRVQTQSALTATDISSFNAANLRVHVIDSMLGQSNRRPYFYIGKKMYRATSDSDHSLADSTLALTNNITAAWSGYLNSTRYDILGTDGDTDDAVGVSNPTATGPTNTKAWAYTAGDWVGGGLWLGGLGPGYNIIYGKVAGVEGLHYINGTSALLTVPTPVVLTDTKDIEGSIATVTTEYTNPASSGVGTRGDTIEEERPTANLYATAVASIWSNTSNIFSSNDAYAIATSSFHAQTGVEETIQTVSTLYSDELIPTDFDFSAVPKGAIIAGVLVECEAHESDAGDNVLWASVQLKVNGSNAGINLGDGAEVTASTNTYKVFGGSTARWGIARLTGEEAQHGLAVALQFSFNEQASASGGGGSDTNTGQINVDHIRVKLTYRMPGTACFIPSGGNIVGVDPSEPNTIYIRAPEWQSETGSGSVLRILWKAVLTYDASGDRPTVALSKVATNLDNVGFACFTMGGIVCVSIDGKNAVLIKDGEPIDLGFGGEQGYTESWHINNIWPADKGFVAGMLKSDWTVRQDWLCTGAGQWHPISPRQTVTTQPVFYAQGVVGSFLRRRYIFNPSTTNTNVTRTFQPVDYDQSPLLDGEIKANGYLTITTPNSDYGGPEEDNKALLYAICQSPNVSATNTIRLRYAVDGGSMTTWGSTGIFTAYGQKITLSAPVAFHNVSFEIGLDNAADDTGSPNGLDILIGMVDQAPPRRQYSIYVNMADPEFVLHYEDGPQSFFTQLETQVNTLAVLSLVTGNETKYVKWGGLRSTYKAADLSGMLSEPDSKEAVIVLTEVAQ